MILSSEMCIRDRAKTVAEFFASKINLATGYQVTVGDKEVSNGISLLIDESLDVNNEGYTLDVTANGVVVKAKTPQGLFYGMQTFMQLLPAEIESPVVVNGIAWTTPCVSVKDEPRFGYRGFMPVSYTHLGRHVGQQLFNHLIDRSACLNHHHDDTRTLNGFHQFLDRMGRDKILPLAAACLLYTSSDDFSGNFLPVKK